MGIRDRRVTESPETIDDSKLDGSLRVYARRWWILAIFSILNCQQSCLWITFSPVADSTIAFFDTTETVVTLQLAFGCLFYLPVVFAVSFVLGRNEHGLRHAVIAGALLDAAATCVRLFALIEPRAWWSMWVISLGQILDSIVGPVVMTAPPQLSAVWFPPEERTTATAIGSLSNSLGSAVGFLLAPYVVQHWGMPALLWSEAVFAIAVAAAICAYFPAKPPSPPSPGLPPLGVKRLRELTDEFWQAVANRSFIVLVAVGGASQGLAAIWSGLLQVILGPLGFSESQAGLLGFSMTIAGIAGGVAIGIVADRFYRRRFKTLMVWLLVASCVCFAWLSISLPSGFSPGPLLPDALGSVSASITLGGMFLGASAPLFYELSAELTYPVPEGTSAGVFTLVINAACLVVVAVSPYAPRLWMNTIMTLGLVLCTGFLVTVKEEYRRATAEDSRSAVDSLAEKVA